MLDLADLRDRCRGALIGVGLGDAIGAPFEGQTNPSPEAVVEVLWSPHDLRTTDDTAMTLAVGEAIVAAGSVDQEQLARHLAVRCLADPDRGYGRTPEVLNAIHRGVPWRDAANTADGGLRGDGAAMRVAPVAIAAYTSAELTSIWAAEQAEVTHAHPTAIDGARLIALAIRHALLSPAPPSWTDRTRLAVVLAEHAQTDRLAQALRSAAPAPGAAIPGTASAAVPAAIHTVALHGDDLTATIRAAVELGGDTDTVAAMAAGTVGAHVGLSSIATGLVERLEGHEQLIALADDLLAVAIREHGPLA